MKTPAEFHWCPETIVDFPNQEYVIPQMIGLPSPVIGVKEPNRHCAAIFGKIFDKEKPREEPVDRVPPMYTYQ